MNDTQEEAITGRDPMKPTDRRRRLRRAVGLAVFVCVATVLLAFVADFTSMRRTSGREIATLEIRRDKLQAIVDRRETEEKQAENDKRAVASVFRQYRDVGDIPDLGGNRVVFHHEGHERLCLYVPQGSHTLEISCAWKPKAAPDTSADVDAEEVGLTGEETWHVPLLPASGYWLAFTADRKGGPIRWELTSNDPEFETRTETVPLEGFSQQGSQWNGPSVALGFPNQSERNPPISKLETAAASPPGVRVMNAKLFGPRDERQYEVAIEARLLSDGPACVSASDAISVIVLKQDDLLLPYEGGGKYELRTPDAATLAPE